MEDQRYLLYKYDFLYLSIGTPFFSIRVIQILPIPSYLVIILYLFKSFPEIGLLKKGMLTTTIAQH